MPGWPASRLTLPATRPPPRTSSTSARPVLIRGVLEVAAWVTDSSFSLWPLDLVLMLETSTSSARVFHSPQIWQRPVQVELAAPQLVQAYLTAALFAIKTVYQSTSPTTKYLTC